MAAKSGKVTRRKDVDFVFPLYVKPMCPMSYVVQKAEETARPAS